MGQSIRLGEAGPVLTGTATGQVPTWDHAAKDFVMAIPPSGTVLPDGTYEFQPLIWNGTSWEGSHIIVIGLINDRNGNGVIVSADGVVYLSGSTIQLGSVTGGQGSVICRRNLSDNPELAFYDALPIEKPEVTGSRGANAALESLLVALADLGLVTDSTTA